MGLHGWMRGVLLRVIVVLAALAAVPVASSQADGRVALVIGNTAYGPEIGRLKNPANDAKLIAATLKGLGFSVALALDADQKAMKRAIKDFGAQLRDAGPNGIGLFYFAGHGLQVDGENFLIPIGAEIEAEGDVSIEAISASNVLAQMQFAGNAVNLVFLDACRNNPLARGFRSTERGLARLDAPRGSFVGYSTAPGEVAEDGKGENSPYAIALAAELKAPGESVDTAHRNVRSKVLAATDNRQTPWDSSSLIGEVVLAAKSPEPAAAAAAPAATPPAGGATNEALFWESIKDSRNPAAFQAYLEKYPNGDFAGLAQVKLAELQSPAAQTAARTPDVQPAPTPEPEPAPAAPVSAAPEIEAMDATYVAIQPANLRAAPSTDAKVLARLKEDEVVAVTGKVKGKDWLRVETGDADGYVSAPLLHAADADEVVAWRTLKSAPTPEGAQAFLKQHPGSAFEPKAKALLASLNAAAQKAAAAKATPAPAGPTPTEPTPAATTPPAPAQPQDPSQPVGTFKQTGSKKFGDGSGTGTWDQSLVFRGDGTAELTLTYTEEYYMGWYLNGCSNGLRKGTYSWIQLHTVEMAEGGSTVVLHAKGPVKISKIEPSCWRYRPDAIDPYRLHWENGVLSDADGVMQRAE